MKYCYNRISSVLCIMGKTTRSVKSDQSGSSNTSKTKMNAPMSFQKIQRGKKKKRNKLNNKLQKIFNQYSQSQMSLTSENSGTSLNETVINKRKLSSTSNDIDSKRKRSASNSSRIIIDDSTLVTNEEPCTSSKVSQKPVHCSTPRAKKLSEPDFIPLFKETNQNNNLVVAQNLNEEITDLTKLATENFTEEVKDLTKEINRDSYLTIDLTTETLNCSAISKVENTVIDLDSSIDNADCTVISVSNANLSMSGDSDVTVLNVSNKKKEKQMRKFAQGIAKMNSSEKGRLLDLITQNIFNGCSRVKDGSLHGKAKTSRTTETVEDTYIKEVILGQTQSHNSIGSNIYNPERDIKNKTGLRMVVIDGSNVAMEHGRGRIFSVKGLKICIDYFLKRGHVVKAFVPRFRCKFGKSSDPRLLDSLERSGLVVYTPSREVQGRMITAYDDRYIVQCAAEFDGVIVSGDNYRDLLLENPRWRFVIENRLLQFTWVNDMIMFPKDPLGRQGPSLEQFLKHSGPPQTVTKQGPNI